MEMVHSWQWVNQESSTPLRMESLGPQGLQEQQIISRTSVVLTNKECQPKNLNWIKYCPSNTENLRKVNHIISERLTPYYKSKK